MRINKYLSSSGLGSRRSVEKLILDGKVILNGQRVDKLATDVSDSDEVLVEGEKIGKVEKVYYLVNKPRGYISSCGSTKNEKKITDLVPSNPKVFPVGRLDKNSEGLIVLTNDGDYAYSLQHPKFLHEKEYIVDVFYKSPHFGRELKKVIHLFSEGILIDKRRTTPARITILSQGFNKASLKIILHEGRNRQIRRTIGKTKLEIKTLERVRIGDFIIGDISSGCYKKIYPV